MDGRTVLEVGGGIGAIQIELLRAGASRAVSIELTPTYEEVARALLAEAGLEDRVQRQVMDFANAKDSVEGADVVILNRVICCYPDMPKLAGEAADHAGQLLVLSFPRQDWWTRFGLIGANFILRIARREFRIFLHSPKDIIATCQQHGLTPTLDRTGLVWTVAAFGRTA